MAFFLGLRTQGRHIYLRRFSDTLADLSFLSLFEFVYENHPRPGHVDDTSASHPGCTAGHHKAADTILKPPRPRGTRIKIKCNFPCARSRKVGAVQYFLAASSAILRILNRHNRKLDEVDNTRPIEFPQTAHGAGWDHGESNTASIDNCSEITRRKANCHTTSWLCDFSGAASRKFAKFV